VAENLISLPKGRGFLKGKREKVSITPMYKSPRTFGHPGAFVGTTQRKKGGPSVMWDKKKAILATKEKAPSKKKQAPLGKKRKTNPTTKDPGKKTALYPIQGGGENRPNGKKRGGGN